MKQSVSPRRGSLQPWAPEALQAISDQGPSSDQGSSPDLPRRRSPLVLPSSVDPHLLLRPHVQPPRLRARTVVLSAALALALQLAPLAAQTATDPLQIPDGLAAHAILSCQTLSIAGNATVVSDGLTSGTAQADQGHVRSNGDVLLDGAVEVHGDAVAGPGHDVVLSGKPALVTGETQVADAAFDCTPIDLDSLRAALEAANDDATLPSTEKGHPALSGDGGRSLVLSGHDSLTLPAGTYLLDELSLTGNSRLRLDGEVRILVTGPIEIKGGSHVNLDGDPYDVRLWSAGATVSIASQSNVFGFLYAPAAAVDLTGQSRLVGGVQADRVTLDGGARVRRVVDDAPPALTVDAPVDGESVERCAVPVAGTASDAEGPFTLTVNGETVVPAPDGSFSGTASLWTDDPGRIDFVATDRAGNATTVTMRVVIVPPTVALASPPPGSLVGSRTVDLAGASGTATEVSVDGQPATVAGDGTFHLEGFDLGPADGLITLELAAANCGGSVTATAVLDLDTLPPVVAIDSPTPGALFGKSSITVGGSVEDAHLAAVTVNGVSATVEGKRFSAEGVTLAEGENSLVATATDALGRQTASTTVVVQLDTTAPTAEITSPVSGVVVDTPAIDVGGTVSDPNLASVVVNGVSATVSGIDFVAHGVALTEGENFLVASAADAVGNTAESPPMVVVLDTLPPAITLDASGLPELTHQPTVTVSGTVSDPHLDTVTVNGVAATVAGKTWVAEDVALVEGANAIVARAVDTLGHGAETPAATVVLDTQPPAVAVTEPAAGAQLDQRTVTVRGTAVDPHLQKVTVGDVEATVSGDTFEAAGVELPEGDATLVAHAIDSLGHAADSAAVAVVVDTQAPVVRLDNPQDPLTSETTVTVTGHVDEPHLAGVTVAGIAATVDEAGNFSVPAVPLVEGTNEIQATADDTFGHEALSEPVLYVLDTTPPAVAITAPADGEVVTSLEAVVSGTVGDANLEGVTVNGVVATVDETAGTFLATIPLQDGANTVTAVATDRAGHSAEAAVTVILDSLPPAITLDQPALVAGQCLAAGAPQTFGGSFADTEPATGLDGQPPPIALEVLDAAGERRSYVGTLSANGTLWTVAGVDLGAADGVATVTVTAADALDNLSHLAASFRVDAAPPRLQLTLDGAPFPGALPGGAPVAGESVALFARAITAAAAVDDSAAAAPPAAVLTLDGAPYAAGTPIEAEGQHLLVAGATDCAGHTASAHAQFAIDRTAPALHSTVPAAGAHVTTAVDSFSGVSDPDLAGATVNGVPAAVADGSFTLARFAWREGDNPVAIELVDRAGNRAEYSVSFGVRTTPLGLEVLESGAPLVAGTTFLRTVHPELRASDSRATVVATLDGAPFVSGGTVAAAGQHQLSATATDDWGRTAWAQTSFTIDLGAGPELALTSPAEGAVLTTATTKVIGTVRGDSPTVSVNGVAATLAGDPTAGATWTVAAVPLEPDVLNTLEVVARDRLGRTATASVSIRVISGGPQIVLLEPADGTTTNRAKIDVAGAVVGGARESADGTATVAGQTVTLAPDGSFRAQDLPLATGPNTLTATVRDRQGRTGSGSVTVTADFTPPTVRFTVDGAPLVDGQSFAQPITLVVEVADDAALGPAPTIRLNGAIIDGAAAPRTEIPLSTGGGYVVSAVIADAAGNQARAERSLVLAFGGCGLADVEPASGSAVASASVTLVGRAGGAAAVAVRVAQPGGGVQQYAASLADGTFLAGDVPLPVVGTNSLELVCTDSAGGVQSTPYTIERLGATDGPTVRITAPVAGAVISADTVAVDGTVSSGSVTVNGIAATVTPASGDDPFHAAAVSLSEGPNPLLALAVDATGRTAWDRVVVDRDTQAPKVQITRPDNHTQVGVPGDGAATIEVSGLVDLDTEPHLSGVVVSTSQGTVTATVDPATGVFVAPGVPLDATTAAGSAQSITATAADSAGHQGTSSVDVILDPTGPAIVLGEPNDLTRFGVGAPAAIAVAGDAWAAPGASISINGVDLDPATLAWEAAGADGRRHVAFTASIAVPGSDGAFGVIARATELDGRWAQDRRLLFRDATAPTVVELVPANGAAGVDANALLLALFSEPIRHGSLADPDGLTLTREGTGQKVVGTWTVAGQAIAFAPGAALAPGESYLLRAGADITDTTGNALAAPAESRFTVASPTVAGAPVLEPLPAVACEQELDVTGHAGAGATIKVRDGDLVFTGYADTSGAFTVTVPISASGYQLLSVWALDPVTGARSPETSAVLRIDCQAPSVVEARLDRSTGVLRIVFSEPMNPASLALGGAGDSVRLLDADVPGVYQGGTLTGPDADVVDIALDSAADAWWRDRPVRLQVGAPAADVDGNKMAADYETVLFPGGGDLAGGFLYGEAYDDSTGRPLAGATVRLFEATDALPGAVAPGLEGTPLAGATTDGRGRFVLTGEVPAGRYVLVVEKAGAARVYRRLSLAPAAGVVPFDSRLTPLAPAAGTLEPATGGTVGGSDGSSGGTGGGGAAGGSARPSLSVDPGALPGDAAVSVILTPRTGQGLPDFLPLGWTPAATVEVRLEQDPGTGSPAALAEQDLWTLGAARVELALPAWAAGSSELYAARYEAATGRWLALPRPEVVTATDGSARARVELAGPGTISVVVPDQDAATRPPVLPAAGEALTGIELPSEVPALTADLTLDPPIVGPTGHSRARVVARSLDGATAWPSGLAVQAYLAERLGAHRRRRGARGTVRGGPPPLPPRSFGHRAGQRRPRCGRSDGGHRLAEPTGRAGGARRRLGGHPRLPLPRGGRARPRGRPRRWQRRHPGGRRAERSPREHWRPRCRCRPRCFRPTSSRRCRPSPATTPWRQCAWTSPAPPWPARRRCRCRRPPARRPTPPSHRR